MKVKMDKGRVRVRIEERCARKVIPALSEQILADSNDYARMDTGALIQSSLLHSTPQTGRLEWRTPYARKVYYTGTPSQDKNPRASRQWVEVARKNHKKDWEKLAQKLYER